MILDSSYAFTLIIVERSGSPVSYQLVKFEIIASNSIRLVKAKLEDAIVGVCVCVRVHPFFQWFGAK
jgi:hypothetical protein